MRKSCVYTLLSITALSGVMEGQAFDTFAIIKTAENFDDWTIRLAQFAPPELTPA